MSSLAALWLRETSCLWQFLLSVDNPSRPLRNIQLPLVIYKDMQWHSSHYLKMSGKKDLTRSKLKLLKLHKAERSLEEIARIFGIMKRCMPKWVKESCEGGRVATMQYKQSPWQAARPHLMSRNVDTNPQVTAREVQEELPCIYAMASYVFVSPPHHHETSSLTFAHIW